MDRISKDRRSKNMSAIKNSGTKPEILMRKYLTQAGVRYRCNSKSLPGKPDVSVKKWKLAVNVHGCFWHGHKNCKNFRLPKSNVKFWREKITRNRERDISNRLDLEEAGFRYFEIWECEIERGDLEKLDEFISEYWKARGID